MGPASDDQSLTSQIIKILRITTEPLSAHAISDIYGYDYKKTKKILSGLKEDNLVYSIKTGRGEFYFIPDKYFKREADLLTSEEILPFVWYEELTENELKARKKIIIKSLKELKKEFNGKKISSIDYFKSIQEKNEELSIINQIIEDRKEEKIKRCYFCKEILKEKEEYCPSCGEDISQCCVCKRNIYANASVLQCPKCKAEAHASHIIEWLKTVGSCPNCKEHILESELISGEKTK